VSAGSLESQYLLGVSVSKGHSQINQQTPTCSPDLYAAERR
jgi:hypothetical protein